MKPGEPSLGLAVFSGLVLAGIVHIVTILALPHLASHNLQTRFLDPADAGKTVPLTGEAGKAASLPFHDPTVAIAACGYDLSDTAVRLRLPAGALLTTLSLHNSDGRAFYAVTDRVAREGVVEIVLMTRAQLDEAIRNDDDEPTGDVRVVAPSLRGIAVARAVTRFPSDMSDAEKLALSLTCKPEIETEE
jgi:uncharacterized membrane protein